MAFNSFEQRLVDQYVNTQFPDPAPEPDQAEAMPPGTQPGDVLVAEAGSRGLPESVYTGQSQAQMTAYDPTVRERLSAFLQAGLEGIGIDRYTARKNAQTIMGGPSSNLPLTMGIADIVPFLGTALQTQEALRMGEDAATSLQQGRYGAAALEAAGAGLGMIPGIGGTFKGLKAIAPMIPKNVPVGASTDVVGGGTQTMLQAGKASAPVSDIGFYSAVEDAALNLQRKSGSGQAMLNDITKAANVKVDEIRWIGLDDFLKGKKNVTREEVQDFIRNNRVDVQEVTLADQPTRWQGNILIIDNQPVGEIRDTSSGFAWKTPDGQYQLLGVNRMFDAVEKVQQKLGVDVQEGASPKFGRYTLPGGENYREILLTLPTQFERMSKPLETEIRALGLNQNLGDISLRDLIDAGASADLQNRFERAMRESAESSYHSSHWDQPNVLAHIRVNDRVDADGKKMLLVEEVQSDWHQAGRDKGYASDIGPKVSDEEYKRGAELQRRNLRGEELTDVERQEMQDILRRHEASISAFKVPDAPMKDTWYQLALKRVLKYAADNGYERVGLTTGARQAERYDLSKQVDELLYDKNPDGTYALSAITGSRGNMLGESIPQDKLADYVGKELADKIMKGEGKRTQVQGNREYMQSLSGIDLKVGGEGMKTYYDEVYPQFLAKYGKKWGAKVGETSVNANGKEPIRYIDITPQMRESVGKGQPLFTATGLGTGAATMQDEENK